MSFHLFRDDAEGLRQTQRRTSRNPLGSAAGYGTPGLPLDREATRVRLGFAMTQEPVTAVQLSRGKAEAQLLFEIVLLMQDLGRLCADVLGPPLEVSSVDVQGSGEGQLRPHYRRGRHGVAVGRLRVT